MEVVYFEDPRNLQLKTGDAFVLDLPYLGGTGYQWEWSSDELLEKVEEEYVEESNAPGGGGRMRYTFRVKATGTTSIELFYWQPWSGKESIDKTLTIEIAVL
ncbi:protease inhibitor I42 family protein [Cryomorphaceae bacterium]|nr:protease inhibitor I42 family protein [Cryomorphaceae bacterium]